jgi:hypothetical protein
MVPARMSSLLLPVRQLVSPALTYSGSSNVAPSRAAAARHHADDATPTTSSHSASGSRARMSISTCIAACGFAGTARGRGSREAASGRRGE